VDFFRFPRPGVPRRSEVRTQHSPMIAARSAMLWLRVAESSVLWVTMNIQSNEPETISLPLRISEWNACGERDRRLSGTVLGQITCRSPSRSTALGQTDPSRR